MKQAEWDEEGLGSVLLWCDFLQKRDSAITESASV